MYSFIVICFFFEAQHVLAQSGNISVQGSLADEESGDGLPFVQVALFEEGKAEPLTFTSSDESGQFRLTVPNGKYDLKFFFVGYENKVMPGLALSGNLNLGKIVMASTEKQLDEVVVTGEKPMMTTSAEGIVINPQQNLSNAGGTLLDILRNTPSVRVADDGSISLRGSSGTNVLLNGRNSSLTQNLDRIPASAIEQVKIITNPNARYDAEAEAGVIDITLKKGIDLGTHGSVNAVYGTRGRMNTGAQINHRAINYNVYGGYTLRRWRNVGYRSIDRALFDDNELLNQETNNTQNDLSHNFNYGADYYFGENIISYQGVFSSSLDEQVNSLYSRLSTLDTESMLLEYVRRNDENETDDGVDNALIYERTFEDKERSFRFSASQSYTNQFKTQNIDIFRNSSRTDAPTPDDQEMATTDEKRYNYVFQADYVHPISASTKFETGLKSNIRNFEYDYDYSRLNNSNQEFVDDPAISNQFDYKDRIHAAYLILSKASKKLDVTGGLRGELTTFDTYLYNTDERNEQVYFNLFPSLQTLYRLSDRQSLKFTYSRRIDRPTAWRLNPFPDITDSLNVRRGNPNLQPEMINSVEFGHIFEAEKSSLTTNLFYRQINGRLDNITTVQNGISYSQPENLNSAQAFGVEVIGQRTLTPWWNLGGSVTGFSISVDGSNVSEEFVNNGFALNSKLTSDFKLPYDITLQMVFNYDSPEVEAQGSNLSQHFLDASVQKSFFDKAGSLSVSVRDVFDTLRFAGDRLTNSFSQSFYAKRETRIVLVSARYNF